MFGKILRFFNSRDYLIESKRIRFISQVFLITLAATLLILILAELSNGGLFAVAIASVLLAFVFLCLILISKNKIKMAFFHLAIMLLAGITAVVTKGQGIHDISIIGFPAILIIGSVFTTRKFYVFLNVLVFLAIAWIVFGDMFALYTPRPHGRADISDFIIVTAIILFTAVSVYVIMNSQNIAFSKARMELQNRKLLARDLKKSLEEKDLLLREIHHRVKNNLSIIISLLNIQGENAASDYRQILQQSINRIYSIALVHEMLYSSSGSSRIPMKDYVSDITTHIIESQKEFRDISIENNINSIQLPLESAIPCGIILNELITNSIKHAFGKKAKGRIEISMEELADNKVELSVCDNGKGIPAETNGDQTTAIGMYLVEQLCYQLNSEMDRYNRDGACFSITFSRKRTVS
jgi:two-component sensor histidine kinase